MPKVISSATIFGAGVSDPDKFQRRLHAIDLNSESGSDLIFIKGVVAHENSFAILYSYELQ